MNFLMHRGKVYLGKVSLLINYDLQKIQKYFYNSITKFYVKDEGRRGSGACGLRVEVLRVTFSRI